MKSVAYWSSVLSSEAVLSLGSVSCQLFPSTVLPSYAQFIFHFFSTSQDFLPSEVL
jgi:hypothetical protein